jgi:exodeoxyribonuclease V beta subunit
VEARRDRLGKAIADFDAATIETTHGFCLQILYGLGTAGDVDREVTLVEDVSDLMEEVVDDLFLRRFAHKPNALEFSRKEAMEIAKAATLAHPDADMVPPCRRRRTCRPSGAASPRRSRGDGGPQEGAQDPDL